MLQGLGLLHIIYQLDKQFILFSTIPNRPYCANNFAFIVQSLILLIAILFHMVPIIIVI